LSWRIFWHPFVRGTHNFIREEYRVLAKSHPIESPIEKVKSLILEYPKMALPVGVFVALIGLATIFKTLIDGFTWASQWGVLGVSLAIGGSIGVLWVSMWWMNRVLRPRPKILPFPKPYFSKSPTVQWEYDEPEDTYVTYEVLVTSHNPEIIHPPIPVPNRMFYAELRDVYGTMDIAVNALNNEKVLRTSQTLQAEIYRNALQRISRTGKLRVAVHADHGEKVFCFYGNGNWQGFDIDLAHQLAKELEQDPDIQKPLDVEFQFYPWPEVIGAPRKFKVDFAIASMSISQKRSESENIIFSEPYAESALGIVAAKSSFGDGVGGAIDLHRLQGKTVAYHKATTAANFVEKVKESSQYGDIRFHMADNNHELRELLQNSSVQAVLYDYHRAYALLETGMFVQYLQHDIPVAPDRYGITFAMISTQLREKVNAILTAHRADLKIKLEKLVKNQIAQSENE